MGSKAIKMKDSKGNSIYPCPYYPVGSIYLSVNSINPANFFGGEWEQINGRFLVGAGTPKQNNYLSLGKISDEQLKWNFEAGIMGGEYSHKLTINEMPEHNHVNYPARWMQLGYQGGGTMWGYTADSWEPTQMLKSAGGNQSHNNMPPYFVVYMWKRIA